QFTLALKIVEKDSADAAHLAAMLQREVLVAPFLKPGIKLGTVTVAGLLDGAMEVAGILCVRIIRREVHASSKPLRIAFFEIPEIRMDRWNHRVSRMKDERNTRCKEFRSAAQGYFRRKVLGQVSLHGRKINAGLLEYLTLLQHSGATTTTAFARP